MSEKTTKREDVLNAALILIAEQGFHAAPISQIAKKANIGVGTIYRYFKSKEDLINALYLEVRKRMADEIVKGRDNGSLAVKMLFVGYLQNLIRYLTLHPTEIQFTQQYENSPFITEDTHNEVNKIASPISDLFMRARDENLLKGLPVTVLMALFSGAAMSLLKECQRHKLSDAETDIAIEAIWQMVAGKEFENE